MNENEGKSSTYQCHPPRPFQVHDAQPLRSARTSAALCTPTIPRRPILVLTERDGLFDQYDRSQTLRVLALQAFELSLRESDRPRPEAYSA